MKDRVPANPGRVLITPEDGSAPFYATMTRADNPTQDGDPLNKNTLLKDATAALFGLGANAVPDDVLARIKTLFDNVQNSADSKAKIATGVYTGTGTYGESNKSSLTFDFVPKFVIILKDYEVSSRQFVWVGGPYAWAGSTGSKTNGPAVSLNDKTISWYIGGDIGQMNVSGSTYRYVALG